MDDVQVFYNELYAASSTLQTAATALVMENASVTGEDTGIENPAYRAALRLEMHRRVSALHERVTLRVDEGSEAGALLTRIADRYTDLDLELTGQEQP